MNYYQPRQREHDKRWDFTWMNDGHIAPVGYCRAYRDLEGEPGVSPSVVEEYRATASKHHTDGHATEAEARACYREYLLDHRLSLGHKDSNTQHKCRVCGEWTQRFATFNNVEIFFLCDRHHSKEAVAGLVGEIGDIISSW